MEIFNYLPVDINCCNVALPSACAQHSQLFLDTLCDLFLYQHVPQPTRYRCDTTPHTLDLVISNEEGMVDNMRYLPGLGNSDHICIYLDFICYLGVTNYETPKYNLHHADYI